MPALNSSPTSSSAMPLYSSTSGLPDDPRCVRIVGQVDRVRVAVEQRQAVEEEGRGERAEQEVLDRGLLREQPAPAGEARHQVQRQRQHLERDEHEQQVVRDDEQQHAADREQRQREDLGLDPGAGGQLAVAPRPDDHGGLGDDRAAADVVAALGDEQQATRTAMIRIVPCRNRPGRVDRDRRRSRSSMPMVAVQRDRRRRCAASRPPPVITSCTGNRALARARTPRPARRAAPRRRR